MWPGLVGKGPVGKDTGAAEPAIGLERMLQLTADARIEDDVSVRFDGVDIFLYHPHIDIDAPGDEIRRLADRIASLGLAVGSVVAPVYPDMLGGSAMGSRDDRRRFVEAVRASCEYAAALNAHGARSCGVIRIDSAARPADWAKHPVENTKKIAETFREAAIVAEGYGERIAAEGEICWAAMHSWTEMLRLLEEVDRPASLGFQADLAHTYLYLLGYNAPESALLQAGYAKEEFQEAYRIMTAALAPWLFDFHVAQTDGTVFGSGSHDRTGRHCPVDSPDGKLDIVWCSRQWLLDDRGELREGLRHICWDGCMFSNAVLENQETWNRVLGAMEAVRKGLQG